MLAENATLNGGAVITNDFLLPGTPSVRLNGRPTYGGTLDGNGAAAPATHEVVLNGNATLRHVVRRTDPAVLPTVAAPPVPTGSISLTISSASQSVGDFGMLRDLILSGGIGQVVVPGGTYGDFTANAGSGFTLGVAGATQPAIYNFQHLILNGQAQIRVVGPVIITVATAVVVNGIIGAPADPLRLTLKIASGGLTVGGGATVYANSVVPTGTVTINGNGQLVGATASDRLAVNGSGLLRLISPAATNQAPTVAITTPSDGASFTAPASLMLAAAASDADGSVAKVEFFRGTTKLGEDTAAPFEVSLAGLAAGSYTFVARATDNLGATADSSPVTIAVTAPNQPPAVVLTAPLDGGLHISPATVLLSATATDADGAIARVEFYQGDTKLTEDFVAPYETSVAGLAAGTYTFFAKAYDDRGASAASLPVTVTVVNPNQPPTVALTAPPDGTTFIAPAAFTLSAAAADPDGTVARVEFYRDAVKLGEDLTAPFEWNVAGLTAGTYNFVARVYDNQNSATDSSGVKVTVLAVNQPPSVTVTSPAAEAVLPSFTPVTLAATATDSDGTIAGVDFFLGATRVGAGSFAPPANYTYTHAVGFPPGRYAVSARATDDRGGVTDSAPVNLNFLARLPYTADFEATEGYAVGSLAGQLGWQVGTGTALIVDDVYYSGGRSVLLTPATTLTQVAQTFAPLVGEPVVFVEFFARPVADVDMGRATMFDVDSARFAFFRSDTTARLQVFSGDGLGGGTWQPTSFTTAANADGLIAQWLRVTVRLDFTNKRWDIYVNGTLVSINLNFRDATRTFLGSFAVRGHPTVASRFDYLFAAATNPLFADADKDGMDDAWELQNGLDPTINDRDGDLDGDGLSNLREFQLGTRANLRDTDGDGMPDGWEVRYGFDPRRPDPPDRDSDGDGLTDLAEAMAGTNPFLADTDGDGLPDLWEVQFGLNPLVNDANADPDGDGLTNLQEYLLGRNPTKGAVSDTVGSVNLRVYSPSR